MSKLTIASLLLLSACGQGPMGLQGLQGPQGEAGAPAPEPVSMEGYYILPNGGYLDMYEDAQGLVTVRSARVIMSNADGSTALVPFASLAAAAPIGNATYYNQNLNYVAATHNVKKDSDNSVLAGSFLTQIRIIKDADTGAISVLVITSSSFGVLFSHSVVSE